MNPVFIFPCTQNLDNELWGMTLSHTSIVVIKCTVDTEVRSSMFNIMYATINHI